ncbi:MAG: 16S rRNA processing protein RimM [Ruminococcaceae bacterium]|nr:16S rRNA processing protein RimM [Oscillospiraceae bacterium]
MTDNKYIECAKVINTHGCRGGIKLESWCNSPYDLAELDTVYAKKSGAYVKYKVLKTSVFKQFVIMELEGVSDMDAALAMKNTVLYADREDFELEDGEFFIADIIGVDVIDAENGTVYGKVTDIINRGASDIYVIETANGERMIPAVDEFIVKVDVTKGVFVKTIPGLLD